MKSISMQVSRPTILNPVGQHIIEKAFRERSRSRASFLDIAEATVRTLEQTGQLSAYTLPGVDPFEAIQKLVDVEHQSTRVREC